MSSSIELNDKILKTLIKTLGKIPKIKVGVLSQYSARSNRGPSNAEIGLKHEFGTESDPMRSFLRLPLMDHLGKKLEEKGVLGQDTLKKIVDEKSALGFANKIGAVGIEVVQEAFDTGGFGQWAPSDMKNKKNKQTLVETSQLRRSISSEVVE